MTRLKLAPILLAVCLIASLAAAGTAHAKKGGGNKTRTFTTGLVDQVIPAKSGIFSPFIASTIQVPRKGLKGRTVADVNLSLRATHPAIFDVDATLTAPNGATSFVVGAGANGQTWGGGAPDCSPSMLTIDDESAFKLGSSDGFQTLGPPYAGTVQPFLKPLAIADGGPVAGTWTLRVRNIDSAMTGLLHCWQLQVKPQPRPESLKPRTITGSSTSIEIPDDPDGFGNGTSLVQSQRRLGKKFKGLEIDDVNVSMRVSHSEVNDLRARLTAPNGASVNLIQGGTGGPSWGSGSPDCNGTPLTIDDETPMGVTTETAPQDGALQAPYAGSAQPAQKPLALMDGGPLRGVWTLSLMDSDPGDVGALSCWKLRIKPRPKPE